MDGLIFENELFESVSLLGPGRFLSAANIESFSHKFAIYSIKVANFRDS